MTGPYHEGDLSDLILPLDISRFNREVLDRFILKPVATAWDFLLPDPFQRGIHNAFDNLAVVRRVVNNALQLKLTGAAKEVARFTINSTVGLAGFFDIAKDGFGIEQSDEDTGQTFGVWGMGPGPYLVLPFLPPLTVRDGIGYAFDSAMTPYLYFIPWYASIGGSATNIVNERPRSLRARRRNDRRFIQRRSQRVSSETCGRNQTIVRK